MYFLNILTSYVPTIPFIKRLSALWEKKKNRPTAIVDRKAEKVHSNILFYASVIM